MKFNFEKACCALLVELGAKPIEYHRPQFELNTIAGRMVCTPFDTWLACRFDDEKQASAKIGNGSLNRFSGKWNWHFVKPNQNDVDFLEETLKGIRV